MSSKQPKNRSASSSPAPEKKSRRNVIVAVVIAVIVAGAAVALLSASGDDDKSADKKGTSTALKGTAETNALFEGIPQKGDTLGSPDAPVTMFEFIDYQCPFCREFALTTYPKIVNKAVKEGKLKIVTRPLAFIGPESEKAARAAAGAAQQNRDAQFTQLFYWNQGAENSGYVTDEFIDKLYDAAGVDKAKANAYRKSADSRDSLKEGQSGAEEYGVVSTPSFVMGQSGGPYEKLDLSLDDETGFETFIDELAK